MKALRTASERAELVREFFNLTSGSRPAWLRANKLSMQNLYKWRSQQRAEGARDTTVREAWVVLEAAIRADERKRLKNQLLGGI